LYSLGGRDVLDREEGRGIRQLEKCSDEHFVIVLRVKHVLVVDAELDEDQIRVFWNVLLEAVSTKAGEKPEKRSALASDSHDLRWQRRPD
jgi:hypothetical protein